MNHVVEAILILRLLKAVTLVAGGIIAYFAAKGYRRSGSSSLLLLSLGFLFVTIGSISAGVLFEFAGHGILEVNVVETSMQVIGFLIIVYSIVGKHS